MENVNADCGVLLDFVAIGGVMDTNSRLVKIYSWMEKSYRWYKRNPKCLEFLVD